jgi:hypothetical protein
MRTLAAILLLIALAAVAAGTDKPREGQESDIREAVFRWQFDHDAATQQKAYFIQVGEKGEDPPEDLMKRFTGNKPPVRKGSQCTILKGNGLVVAKDTGEPGRLFRVETIGWKSDTEVEVRGGYYQSSRGASGNIYTVKKEKGRWRVTNDKVVCTS